MTSIKTGVAAGVNHCVRSVVLMASLAILPMTLLAGPVDPFGELDVVTVERTVVQATETGAVQFSVRVLLKNDEQIGSVTIPLAFDQTKLTLTGIDFTNSRASHIATRLVAPNPVASAPGHFLVGIVRIQENAIQPGDGLLFTAKFTVSGLQPGDSAAIDSLFYAPSGELVMAEAGTAATIRPAFVSGMVVLRPANRQPLFSPLADLSILEGESLSLNLAASDPDADPLTFSATSKPSGAMLSDHANGTATLSWQPDFIGPNSADGSPFTMTMKVSDGKTSSFESFAVTVINRNRLPVLTAPSTSTVKAGLPVAFDVNGTDADFESISYQSSTLPVGSSLNSSTGEFSWGTVLADSGTYVISIIGRDPLGGADTVTTVLTVEQALVYQLSLDTIAVNLGSTFTLPVRLSNLNPIAGYELLIAFDPSLMNLVSVTRDGTRSAGFEEFNFTNSYSGVPGHLYIRGKADLPSGEVTAPLASGSGVIANLRFQIGSDLNYAGLSVPTRFELQNLILNTLLDPNGVPLNRSEINFSNGLVSINSIGTILTGDINQNGLPYEIGDAIYFTNFIIDPVTYPFNLVQYANSDINKDGIVASISDLVRLISIIVQGSSAPSMAEFDGEHQAEMRIDPADAAATNQTVRYAATEPTGAILLTFPHAAGIDPSSITTTLSDMTLAAISTGDTLRVLIYSLQGNSIPSGDIALLSIPAELSTSDLIVAGATDRGEELRVLFASGSNALPNSFALEQNYPNPFNPETNIRFSLAVASPVELVIHNIAGQEVRLLASRDFEAGQHDVRWDGTDETGQTVASGIYFYRLTTRGETATRKMLLMK